MQPDGQTLFWSPGETTYNQGYSEQYWGYSAGTLTYSRAPFEEATGTVDGGGVMGGAITCDPQGNITIVDIVITFIYNPI